MGFSPETPDLSGRLGCIILYMLKSHLNFEYINIFFQLNHQRDQVAAITDKQQEREQTDDREHSQVLHSVIYSWQVYRCNIHLHVGTR